MKKVIFMLSFIASLILQVSAQSAQAQTVKVSSGQFFHGQEQINENPTGNICYVTIKNVAPLATKGFHCYDMEVQFAFNNSNLSKDPILLQSRITNAHRSEYPAIKSCAANLQGQTSGMDIYGTDTNVLFTPFFSASSQDQSNQYDYFVSIDAATKLPTRARVHVMNWHSENNYDCVGLQSLN